MSRFNEKIKVLILVDDSKDIKKYFKLFNFLLEDNISEAIISKGWGTLEGRDFKIDIYRGGEYVRGMKAHYVLNLVQDLELHNSVAIPLTAPFSSLLDDPKWKKLFI